MTMRYGNSIRSGSLMPVAHGGLDMTVICVTADMVAMLGLKDKGIHEQGNPLPRPGRAMP